jgi:hypothetical protein
MPDNADSAAAATCSPTSAPGATTEPCPLKQRKVLELKWEHDERWCSEKTSLSGKTRNYVDGETFNVNISVAGGGNALNPASVTVTGEVFGSPFEIVDILPSGGPSWRPRSDLDAEASGVKTPAPLSVRFIPNVTRDKKSHNVIYKRTNPATATKPAETVDVEMVCKFELESANYLVTFYGDLKYTRGWGRERLELGDATLTGGFSQFGVTNHWGKQDALGNWQYWDGSAWQTPPAAWIPDNSNHFGAPFYKSGSSWFYRDNPALSFPDTLSDWPEHLHKGAGNFCDTKLGAWKTEMDSTWSDKFDLKRKNCKSTAPECCRYKTRCVTQWIEAPKYGDDIIIVYYENYRSDASSWSLGDNRVGLASHEFGHLLAAPDEYGGVFSTQLGVNDSDGLSNGIDPDCIMGVNLSVVKKRHLRGVCEMLARLVKDQFGRDYEYEAVDKAGNLASPPGTAITPDPGRAGGVSGTLIGAIIGGVVGAIAGAIIGFVASGGNPLGAVLGGIGGALLGAAAGAGIGSLF